MIRRCDLCNNVAKYDVILSNNRQTYVCDIHYHKYVKDIESFRYIHEESMFNRQCILCNTVKPMTEFYRYIDHNGIERYRRECKKCNLQERKTVRIKKEMRHSGHKD